MIIGNNKPIRIIGYNQSTMTLEFLSEIQKTHDCQVVEPAEFEKSTDQDKYQYIISVSWDLAERQKVICKVDQLNLDLITFIHSTVVIGNSPAPQIGPGSFIFPYSTIAIGSRLGRHCIIGYYSLIGHYSQLGSNCLLRPGSMVNGKSYLGDHCVMNTRSTITGGANITNNVTLMAFCSVTKNLTESGYYAGSPSRKIK